MEIKHWTEILSGLDPETWTLFSKREDPRTLSAREWYTVLRSWENQEHFFLPGEGGPEKYRKGNLYRNF